METVQTKRCPKCGEEKALTKEFWYSNKECLSGLSTSACKDCMKKTAVTWNMENKDKRKENKSRWERDNHERIRIHQRIRDRRDSKALSDGYVKRQISHQCQILCDDVTPEMVGIKRQQILLSRAMRDFQKEAV